MFSFGIIIASDKASLKQRVDESGPKIKSIMPKDYVLKEYIILPDDQQSLENAMIHMCDDLKLDLILTSGGTGFSQRDVTPEATLNVVTRLAPGIAEAIRAYSLSITKRAMLSRGVSGIRNKTLIINLPGSPKAVSESLDFILSTLKHGIEILKGEASECGRS